MSFGWALALLFLGGCAASLVAWRFDRISATAWFRWGGLFLWIALLLNLRAAVGRGGNFDVFMLITLLLFGSSWIPFIIFFLVGGISSAVRKALSLDDMTIRPYYSHAEAAQKRGDLQEALRLYREVAAEHPGDPEPRRRAGELCLQLDQPDAAIRLFREAEELCASPEDKATHVFSIAETLSDCKKDIPAAIQALERFVADYPDAAARAYAERRIALLKERIAAGC